MISTATSRTTDRLLAEPDGSVLLAALDLRALPRDAPAVGSADIESTGEDLNGVTCGSRSFLKSWRTLRATFRWRLPDCPDADETDHHSD